METKKKIIEIKNITKEFKEDKTLKACDNISFDVYEGEFLAIVGESGSGKTTLMRIMSNLENKTSGEILYSNTDITTLKGESLRLNRKNIQLLFQDTSSSLNPKMKVVDIICEPLINFNLINKKDKRKIALEYLKKVELDETFLDKYPREMSGGQRQRIGLARALTLNPKILILDEPTSALDVIIQKKILELIKNMQKEYNLTILFISHDLVLVSKISDRIVVMKKGRVIETINSNKILEDGLQPYTKKLISSVFDIKKCGCRLEEACLHKDFS